MLTEQRVTELFMEYLPNRIRLSFARLPDYISDAIKNDFVLLQMQLGIYDEKNIRDDFLGVAKSIVIFNEVVVCLDLINHHVDGLGTELAEAYVRHVAAHEAHHFEHDHRLPSSSTLEQARREQACNEMIAMRYPDLEEAWERVQQQSVTIQRVYGRIRNIREARHV